MGQSTTTERSKNMKIMKQNSNRHCVVIICGFNRTFYFYFIRHHQVFAELITFSKLHQNKNLLFERKC